MHPSIGKMLEWLKRHVWKACDRPKRFQGSNPCLSAKDLIFKHLNLGTNPGFYFIINRTMLVIKYLSPVNSNSLIAEKT